MPLRLWRVTTAEITEFRQGQGTLLGDVASAVLPRINRELQLTPLLPRSLGKQKLKRLRKGGNLYRGSVVTIVGRRIS